MSTQTPLNQALIGDARKRLAELPEKSIDCVITSPPYYQLRNYAVSDQIGLEPNVEGWVDELRTVFAGLARVLKPSGSVWLNLGDSFSRHPRYGAPAKSLLLGPERLALALTEDGWTVRNKIVWAKTNAMPHSVVDRLATKHEVIYFLTRSRRYYFDLDAIREPHRSGPGRARPATDVPMAAPPWAGPLAGSNSGLARMKASGRVGSPPREEPRRCLEVASFQLPRRPFRHIPGGLGRPSAAGQLSGKVVHKLWAAVAAGTAQAGRGPLRKRRAEARLLLSGRSSAGGGTRSISGRRHRWIGGRASWPRLARNRAQSHLREAGNGTDRGGPASEGRPRNEYPCRLTLRRWTAAIRGNPNRGLPAAPHRGGHVPATWSPQKGGDAMKTLAIRLEEEQHAQLSVIAQLKELTVTDAIRQAIEQWMEARRDSPALKQRAQAVLEDIEQEAASRRSALAALLGDKASTPPAAEESGGKSASTNRRQRDKGGGQAST